MHDLGCNLLQLRREERRAQTPDSCVGLRVLRPLGRPSSHVACGAPVCAQEETVFASRGGLHSSTNVRIQGQPCEELIAQGLSEQVEAMTRSRTGQYAV